MRDITTIQKNAIQEIQAIQLLYIISSHLPVHYSGIQEMPATQGI